MRRALIGLLAFVAALLFALPAYAVTGEYSIDELSTEMTVEPNATVRIVEKQTVTFEGDNTGLVWYLHVPESGETVRISSVKTAPVDKGGTQIGDWTYLQMVDANPQRQGRNPGDSAVVTLRSKEVQPWYSYRVSDGMMRCYFPLTNSGDDPSSSDGASSSDDERFLTQTIEVDYEIRHRVRVYRDVAELYWRYVNDSLPSDSSDVNFQIKLPVPEWADPESVMSGIRAWGHGPNEGTFSVADDGVITYHIDSIAKGSYAEAHVIFPADWMTDMAPNAPNSFSNIRGAQAISEESEWVDRSKREIAWDNNVRMMFLVIVVVVVVVGLANALRHGRSPRARRAIVRLAATLAIIALAEQLFFREPLTTLVITVLAILAAVSAFFLPLEDEAVDNDQLGASDDMAPENGGAAFEDADAENARRLGDAGEDA